MKGLRGEGEDREADAEDGVTRARGEVGDEGDRGRHARTQVGGLGVEQAVREGGVR